MTRAKKREKEELEQMITALPKWSVRARAARRQTLVTGQGFFEFAMIPFTWRTGARRCAFCQRGQRDGLTGLWEFGQGYVCTACAEDIVNYRMPVAWRG